MHTGNSIMTVSIHGVGVGICHLSETEGGDTGRAGQWPLTGTG